MAQRSITDTPERKKGITILNGIDIPFRALPSVAASWIGNFAPFQILIHLTI